MNRACYRITIGGWSVDSAGDPRTELVELETYQSLHAAGDWCRIVLYGPAPTGGGSLAGLAGPASAAGSALGLGGALGGGGGGGGTGFTTAVRGQTISQGDAITVELTAGDTTAKVMTAAVQRLESSLGCIAIVGRTDVQKLAETRINQIYQNQNLSQIAQDLASQAGVDIGDIDTGGTYPYFVVHESKNLLRCLAELAARDGLDFYFDPDNRLTMKKFSRASADHTFKYGVHILDLHVAGARPVSDHVVVYGESPSSSRGSNSWHWLAKDLSPFTGEAGQGSATLPLADYSLRTKDGANKWAASRLDGLTNRATLGRLKALGSPQMRLGDALGIEDAPRAELNGVFKVVAVRHIFSKTGGFLTYVDFTGKAGAGGGGGASLGGLGGLL